MQPVETQNLASLRWNVCFHFNLVESMQPVETQNLASLHWNVCFHFNLVESMQPVETQNLASLRRWNVEIGDFKCFFLHRRYYLKNILTFAVHFKNLFENSN